MACTVDVTKYKRSSWNINVDFVYSGSVDVGVNMREDPIVAEVRRARLEIDRECEEDFARIYARALEVQKKAAARLVSRPGADKITMREIDRETTAHRKEKRLEHR